MLGLALADLEKNLRIFPCKMMGEISYKISQLGPGIGGGARILNKPHSSLTPREVEKQGIDKKQSHFTHLETTKTPAII